MKTEYNHKIEDIVVISGQANVEILIVIAERLERAVEVLERINYRVVK